MANRDLYGASDRRYAIDTLPNARETAIARTHGGHPDQLYQRKIDNIIADTQAKQERWEGLRGPEHTILHPGGGVTPPMKSFPVRSDKGEIFPGWYEAGITNPNLRGYNVMNAGKGGGGFMDWLFAPTPWQRLRDWEQNWNWGREKEQVPDEPWQSAEGYGLPENIEKEYNKFQMRRNELAGRNAEEEIFRSLTEQGLYPWNLHTRPITTDGRSVNEFGESLWDVRPENVEKINVEKIIEKLEANRGGLMSLV